MKRLLLVFLFIFFLPVQYVYDQQNGSVISGTLSDISYSGYHKQVEKIEKEMEKRFNPFLRLTFSLLGGAFIGTAFLESPGTFFVAISISAEVFFVIATILQNRTESEISTIDYFVDTASGDIVNKIIDSEGNPQYFYDTRYHYGDKEYEMIYRVTGWDIKEVGIFPAPACR